MGASYIEVVLSVAIIGILVSIVLNPYILERKKNNLRGATLDAVALIRQAQGKTLFSENNNKYGVHLQSDKLVLFTGSSYSSNASDNIPLILPANFSIGSISLNGSGSDIIFDRLTGETSQYGTFNILYTGGTPSATINITQTGLSSSNL